MNKRLLSLMLCILLMLSSALPVFAADREEAVADLTISTVEEFLDFAERCRLDSYSLGLVVALEADLDLRGTEFESIPTFSGTFMGNGHTISGLSVTREGSVRGLFRYLTETAVVQELHVRGEVAPGGSRNEVGGIAGRNSGTITGCSFSGSVSGSSGVGGIVGVNQVTGIIEHCTVTGSVQGDHSVGGIAGENGGVIRSCVNQADINTTVQQNSIDISDITLETLTDSESAGTVTDIGGIAGTSSGVIRDCSNHGHAGYPHMGYNIGGIAGTQSGYIAGCVNYGEISGRKEVGGIVGQMEPVTKIEYTRDTLQILQGQMNALSSLADKAAGNAQSNAGELTGQVGQLREHAETASDAVSVLLPGGDEDEDTILAARNSLSSSVSSMTGAVSSINSSVQNTASQTVSDLNAISAQIGAMGQTLSGASENMGGTFTDVSDEDTADELSGKVADCINRGSVFADLNAGGIAAAMAMENDLDPEEDLQFIGDSSMNFNSQLRAVVLACENTGTVTCQKQNAGGIVGWQAMGLVKDCLNTGDLDTAGIDYAGGVAGRSNGYIRRCSAKCLVAGETYVGGIAGSGTIVTDCRSMVRLDDGTERMGMVLGWAEDAGDEEDPISGNYYLCTQTDLGAIDGISYAGAAEPLEQEAFMALEDLEDVFGTVNVTFVYDNGEETVFTVPAGGDLPMSDVPGIPARDGYAAAWEGLSPEALSGLLFDTYFTVVYTGQNAVIAADTADAGGKPVMLVQGAFTADAVLTVTASDEAPALGLGEAPAAVWDVTLSETGDVTAGRCLIPEGYESDRLKVLVHDEDGWRTVDSTADGSYLVFAFSGSDDAVALVETPTYTLVVIVVLIGALLLAWRLYGRLRNKKKVTTN